MPQPSSTTSMHTHRRSPAEGRRRAPRIVTRPPGAQASQAFMTRFTITCWSWSGSAATSGSVSDTSLDARGRAARLQVQELEHGTDDRRHRDDCPPPA